MTEQANTIILPVCDCNCKAKLQAKKIGRPRLSEEDKQLRENERVIQRREYQKMLRQTNKEKCNEYRQRWYDKHKDELKQTNKLKNELLKKYMEEQLQNSIKESSSDSTILST